MNDNIYKSMFSGCDFSDADKSYSPLFSNFGLAIDENKDGISEFCLNYNRKTSLLWNRLVSFNLKLNSSLSTKNGLVFGNNEAFLSFYDTDSFFFDYCSGNEITVYSDSGDDLESIWCSENIDGLIIFRGYSKNRDDRDPDENVPFITGMKIYCGVPEIEGCSVKIQPVNGKISFAFSFSVFDIDRDILVEKLISCKYIDSAKKKSGDWFDYCLKDLFDEFNDNEKKVISKALLTMLFNLTKAPGNLEGYISSFPSRGGYPTHFLWDSCFQNLAYETINPSFARDSLLLHKSNQRCDGKYGQFLCSTWVRPHYSQPALIGWASLRLIRKTDDIEFARKILPSLEKNNYWWLTRRMTGKGIIYCPHGLETGQDDSPRFDNGATYSCDMNSYLINQMRCTAEIAAIIGDTEKSELWNNEADRLAENIVKCLYDKERNIFFDVDVSSGKSIEIITTASFMPLWAGVPLDEESIDSMIKDYLINPAVMFGRIPFPSVAYNDKYYESSMWWRGPTWMPVAYLLTEVLDKYGYITERNIAYRRMYETIINDGEIHELFDSKTGEGLGETQQGWTGAVFLDIAHKLRELKQ